MFTVNEIDLIKDPFILRDEYIPPNLTSREEQKEILKQAWSPAMKNRDPLNVLFHGTPGTGKTTLSQWSKEEFRKASNVPIAYVNSWEKNTVYNIFDSIRLQIGAGLHQKLADEQIVKDVKNKIRETPLIVILDEFDHIADLDT